MEIFEIPMTSAPQFFPIKLSGVLYVMTFRFRNAGQPGAGGDWVIDIADEVNAPLVCGIPLVTGANMLEQYAYLGFGGELWVVSDGDKSDVPTFDTLGLTSHLLWVVP